MSAGDTVKFYVAITIPVHSDGNVKLSPVVKDTMTNLVLVDNSWHIYKTLNNEIGALSNEINNAVTRVNKPTNENLPYSFTLNSDQIAATEGSSQTFYLSYEATVTSDIAKSNEAENEAFLEYRTSAIKDSVTKTDSVGTNLHSYTFELDKTDMDGNALQNAEFEVYKGDSTDTLLHL